MCTAFELKFYEKIHKVPMAHSIRMHNAANGIAIKGHELRHTENKCRRFRRDGFGIMCDINSCAVSLE